MRPNPGGAPRLEEVSFEVRGGEAPGIGGLMGARRSELVLHLFGAWGRGLSGDVLLDGAPAPRVTHGRRAIR